MRWARSAEVLPPALAATLPWLVCVLWPAMALMRELAAGAADHGPMVSMAGRSLLVRSLLWNLGLAAGSTAIAAIVLRTFLALAPRGRRLLALCTLGTALLAPWILFAAWWTLLAPGNAVHDWLVSRGQGVALRRITLVLGTVGWGWAPAAIVLWWWRSTGDPSEPLLDRLDGVRGPWRLLRSAKRSLGGVVLSVIVLSLAFAADVVCFDLAQERSIGFELRSLEAQRAPISRILVTGAAMSLCSLGLLALAGGSIWWRVARDHRSLGAERVLHAGTSFEHEALQHDGARRVARLAGWLVVGAMVMAPLLLVVARTMSDRRPWDFLALYGTGAVNALLTSLGAGMAAAVLAGAHALLAIEASGAAANAGMTGRPGGIALRLLEATLVAGWAVMAVIPSAVAAGSMAAAWCDSAGGWFRDWPVIVVAGSFTRFAVVAAMAGAITGRIWSRRHRDLERLDRSAACTPAGWWAAASARSPTLLGAALMGGVAVAALSAGEITVSARLEPPGFEWIASSLLAAIHYQRPGAAMASIAGMAVAAFAAGAILVWIGRRLMRNSLRVISIPVALLLPSLAVACDRAPQECSAIPGARVIGGPGVVDGRFDRPRAVAVDPQRGEIVVIDKTARVQRFDREGSFLGSFTMPERALGQPVGVSVGPDGSIIIPDTHYHRIIIADPDGTERGRFGAYGFDPGEFVYPTDVILDPDGAFIIGEYGGVDRIQILAPDGRPLRVIGSGAGAEPGALERPQSLALSRDGRELFVADACNHRIQVFDARNGELLRVLGSVGVGPGHFSYPWAVVVLPDGTLLVAEQGNSRLQRIDPQSGRSLGMVGGRGREPGRLDRPWGLAADERFIYIADTGNNRVQMAPIQSVLAAGHPTQPEGAIPARPSGAATGTPPSRGAEPER